MPIRLKIFPFVLLIFFSQLTNAQSDTAYIGSFQKKNYLQLYSGSYSRNIEFTPTNKMGMAHTINLSPNSSAFSGFVLGYKKFVLYGDFIIPKTSKVNKQETNIKAVSLFLSHFKYKWGITGFVSYNRGLLMAQDNMPMMYGNRSDLRMFTVGAHVYKIFNPKRFSYTAANSQQMLQQKSAGSFIIAATPSYRIIQSNNSIIPSEISKYHLTGEMIMSRQVHLYSLQVKPGYAYNFVMQKGTYFIAPAIYAGTGVDYHLIHTVANKQFGFNLNAGYRLKLTSGINKQRFYGTVEYVLDHTRSYLYHSTVKNTYRECTLNFGWRF